MPMSMHVIAFRTDERFLRMKAAYDACVTAGVEPPLAIWDFFNGEKPCNEGFEIDIRTAVEDWGNDMQEGYQIDMSKIPKGVRYIRFYRDY